MTGAKQVLHLVFVLWGISLGTFMLFSLMPGDPAEIILRDRYEAPNPEQVTALRREMGLEAAWTVRYLRWMGDLFSGDWGKSWRTGQPVASEIASRLPATLFLASSAFAMVVGLSIIFGVCGAIFKNRLPDHLLRTLTVILSAMPAYWLGLMLIYGVSFKMGLLPVAGSGGPAHLVLPATTLALAVAVLQGRVLRAAIIEIMSKDFIRFAVAKGLPARTIFIRHMVRNVLPPMVTLWGMSLGQLLGGAVIVESIFAWPGIGQLTVTAVASRDMPLVQILVLLMAALFVGVNLAVTWLHGRLNPKIGTA